jgi:hypothetical protein
MSGAVLLLELLLGLAWLEVGLVGFSLLAVWLLAVGGFAVGGFAVGGFAGGVGVLEGLGTVVVEVFAVLELVTGLLFGVMFVAPKLGVPRKSRETKPPTTSKIRVIIKVSTQFRRHHPIGFMALLYPYIHVKVRLSITSGFELTSSVENMAKSGFLK